MSQLIKGKQIKTQTITINGSTGHIIAQGDLDMINYAITTTQVPTTQYQVTNKAYVDSIAQGLIIHAPVRVVLTGQTTLVGLLNVEGIALDGGNRVLVDGQTDQRENGLYNVQTGTTAWTRTLDADGTPASEIATGDFVFVETGITYSHTSWVLSFTDAYDPKEIAPGVSKQVWYQMYSPGTYNADGQGLKLTGTTFGLDLVVDGGLSQSISGLEISGSYRTSLSTTITNLISTETSTRISGDDLLTSSLSTETSKRISGDDQLTSTLSSEISVRTSADISLSTIISSEISIRTSADISLSTIISSEISIRTSADISLSTVISSEISTRISGDDLLTSSLSTETSKRISGDDLLTSSLSTETSKRISGDDQLTSTLSTETSLRISGDDSLSKSIQSSVSGDFSTETSKRISGDNSLASVLSTETSTRISGDDLLTSSLSTETSKRISGDSSLATAINDINNPNVYVEYGTGTAGTTTSVSQFTTFLYGTGVVDEDSVFVFVNGVEYRFNFVSGSTGGPPNPTFHTYGVVPTGAGTLLHFDYTTVNFQLDATDEIIVKYIVVT